MTTSIMVNGKKHQVDSDADTPLLYVLRNDLELTARNTVAGLGNAAPAPYISTVRQSFLTSLR